MIHRLYALAFAIWRPRRMRLFLDLVRPRSGETILDVGGTPGTWAGAELPGVRIEIANTDARIPGAIVADGCALLLLGDRSRAVVFSNSTIEHVGDRVRQQAFASEVRRVGDALWIQTPAREFFFEPHWLAPFVHWAPAGAQLWLARWCTPRGWLDRRTVEDMAPNLHLLTRSEMQALFPDCEILVERWLGMPKSYIALRPRAFSSN